MSDQTENMVRNAPGVPVIPFVNWGGLQALYVKEVRRFFKVQLQTIWAPAITTLLFLVIFSVALGRSDRQVMGQSFADFVAPGLIVMGMMQNAFANASFSLLVGKMQGTIIDYLMPPLSSFEVMLAIVGASVTRAIFVGLAVWVAMLFWPGVHIMPRHLWAVISFGLLGSVFLSLIGLITSIWSEKFDQNAAVTNFVIQPLSLLSGTFYSVESLHSGFQLVSQFNPFFYIISGFRYGFLGTSDSSLSVGLAVLIVLNVLLGWLGYALLASGWRIKN